MPEQRGLLDDLEDLFKFFSGPTKESRPAPPGVIDTPGETVNDSDPEFAECLIATMHQSEPYQPKMRVSRLQWLKLCEAAWVKAAQR